MSSLISGIIDCVARPSTSDSPVRVVRKTNSKTTDSPKSIADAQILTSTDSYSTSASQIGSGSISSTSSHAMIPSEATAVFPVSTAEAVIMIPSSDNFNEPSESDDTCDDHTISSNSVDNAIRQQFEAAFATFLYKNPAFTSMSHANLSRVRAKLLKESAKNARAEAELRRQLNELREKKRKTELDLQRELLVVTRAKATREAELRHQIWKMRQATMSMDEIMKKEMKKVNSPSSDVGSGSCNTSRCSSPVAGGGGSPLEASSVELSLQGYPSPSSSYHNHHQLVPSGQLSPYGSLEHSGAILAPQIPSWATNIEGSQSFQEEVYKTQMEYARISAEMEKLKLQIADSSI